MRSAASAAALLSADSSARRSALPPVALREAPALVGPAVPVEWTNLVGVEAGHLAQGVTTTFLDVNRDGRADAATVFDDFSDHLGARGYGVVRGQGKRRDGAGAMACDAVLADERRHVVRIRHLFDRRSRLPTRDDTTVYLRLRNGHAAACYHGLDGLAQVRAGRGGLGPADTILVVDPAAIAQHVLRIEHDDLRSARHAQSLRRGGSDVFHKREFAFEANSLLGHVHHRIGRPGVDCKKLHASIPVFLVEPL